VITTIQNILDQQISEQVKKPNVEDIVEYSCLFSYTEHGNLEYTAHDKCCIPRVMELLSILKHFNIKNTSFLLYTHDYTKDYEDNRNYVLCFGKKKNQLFITIPNNHLLNGTVDYFLNEVRMNDIEIDHKSNQSLFIGGPNGGISGPRSEYVFSGLDNVKHKIILTNCMLFNIQQQLKFKFLINIDGNGMCYDRLYWQLASNSIPVYLQRNEDIVQLHDSLILPNVHYLKSSIADWGTTFETLGEDIKLNEISSNGKSFTREHFGLSSKNTSIQILKYTIEQISKKQNAN
jgi:hypothetical protein